MFSATTHPFDDDYAEPAHQARMLPIQTNPALRNIHINSRLAEERFPDQASEYKHLWLMEVERILTYRKTDVRRKLEELSKKEPRDEDLISKLKHEHRETLTWLPEVSKVRMSEGLPAYNEAMESVSRDRGERFKEYKPKEKLALNTEYMHYNSYRTALARFFELQIGLVAGYIAQNEKKEKTVINKLITAINGIVEKTGASPVTPDKIAKNPRSLAPVIRQSYQEQPDRLKVLETFFSTLKSKMKNDFPASIQHELDKHSNKPIKAAKAAYEEAARMRVALGLASPQTILMNARGQKKLNGEIAINRHKGFIFYFIHTMEHTSPVISPTVDPQVIRPPIAAKRKRPSHRDGHEADNESTDTDEPAKRSRRDERPKKISTKEKLRRLKKKYSHLKERTRRFVDAFATTASDFMNPGLKEKLKPSSYRKHHKTYIATMQKKLFPDGIDPTEPGKITLLKTAYNMGDTMRAYLRKPPLKRPQALHATDNAAVSSLLPSSIISTPSPHPWTTSSDDMDHTHTGYRYTHQNFFPPEIPSPLSGLESSSSAFASSSSDSESSIHSSRVSSSRSRSAASR